MKNYSHIVLKNFNIFLAILPLEILDQSAVSDFFLDMLIQAYISCLYVHCPSTPALLHSDFSPSFFLDSPWVFPQCNHFEEKCQISRTQVCEMLHLEILTLFNTTAYRTSIHNYLSSIDPALKT